jgi:hypothetical protein
VPSNKSQRDSEVQVDYLRGASEVGTGLSVTRHDKAKKGHSCLLPADGVLFTGSLFDRLPHWAMGAVHFFQRRPTRILV